MCKVLEVSKSGYHAWINRPDTPRTTQNKALEKDIKAVFEASNGVYGGKKIKKAILKKPLKERNFKGSEVNHNRIERLMRKLEIRCPTPHLMD